MIVEEIRAVLPPGARPGPNCDLSLVPEFVTMALPGVQMVAGMAGVLMALEMTHAFQEGFLVRLVEASYSEEK